MRFNTNGVIGLAAIIGMIIVALSRKGWFIPVIIFLIIAYGTALLIFSHATESGKFYHREEPDRDFDNYSAQIRIFALHVAFALTLATFFLGLHHQPFINLGMAPLAVLVSDCLVGMTLIAAPESIKPNTRMMWAVLPVIVLLALAAFKKWDPLWYVYLALVYYCWLMIAHSMEEYRPWAGWNNWPSTLLRARPTAANDRFQLGIYSSLIFVGLGLLIDVNSAAKPHWMPGGLLFYHIIIRVLLGIGCVAVGLVLPLLLLTGKDKTQRA